MDEIDRAVRKIVREEIEAYFKDHSPKPVSDEGDKATPKITAKIQDDDYAIFEQKYHAALKIDDEVTKRYEAQVQKHGVTMTMEQVESVLKLSKYAIRKLSKEDPDFPRIVRGEIDTARLMHWLDGGKAYWRLDEAND